MSPALDRFVREFATLTPVEKIAFLKSITPACPGEWLHLDGQLHFIPEGSSAPDEEKEIFARADAEIEAGEGITLNELRTRLNI